MTHIAVHHVGRGRNRQQETKKNEATKCREKSEEWEKRVLG